MQHIRLEKCILFFTTISKTSQRKLVDNAFVLRSKPMVTKGQTVTTHPNAHIKFCKCRTFFFCCIWLDIMLKISAQNYSVQCAVHVKRKISSYDFIFCLFCFSNKNVTNYAFTALMNFLSIIKHYKTNMP